MGPVSTCSPGQVDVIKYDLTDMLKICLVNV